MLPDELQSEALQFVESRLARQSNGHASKQPFESARGVLQGNFDTLDEDIAQMRREAWKGFPRDIKR
jgi:hypothetical protein